VTDGHDLIEPVRAFLSAPRCAVLSTIGRDGAPRQIVIHYLLVDSHLRINGHRDRRWVANLRRDPRASLIIHDRVDYLHYVSIRGTATLVDDGATAVAEAMSQVCTSDVTAAQPPPARGVRRPAARRSPHTGSSCAS
jgi:PPOX class probable F420-dependent enzyme